MSGFPPIQIFSTVVGLGFVYLAYHYRRKTKTPDPFDRNDGLDPNYPGGKKINPESPVDPGTTTLPSCQLWNNEQNLFENAGHPDWDKSVSACFNGTNLLPSWESQEVRYVAKDGTMSWKNDMLQGGQGEQGTCNYLVDGKLYSHENLASFVAPPNRAPRLCFDSAGTQSQMGMVFSFDSNPGEQIWNPNVSFVGYGNDVENLEGKRFAYPNTDGSFTVVDGSIALPEVDQCQSFEELQNFENPSDNNRLRAWVPRKDLQQRNTLKSCVVDKNHRFWMPSQQKIVYLDPDSNTLVETPMRPST